MVRISRFALQETAIGRLQHNTQLPGRKRLIPLERIEVATGLRGITLHKRFGCLTILRVHATLGAGRRDGDGVAFFGPEDHRPCEIDQGVAHGRHFKIQQAEQPGRETGAVQGVVDLEVAVHHGEFTRARSVVVEPVGHCIHTRQLALTIARELRHPARHLTLQKVFRFRQILNRRAAPVKGVQLHQRVDEFLPDRRLHLGMLAVGCGQSPANNLALDKTHDIKRRPEHGRVRTACQQTGYAHGRPGERGNDPVFADDIVCAVRHRHRRRAPDHETFVALGQREHFAGTAAAQGFNGNRARASRLRAQPLGETPGIDLLLTHSRASSSCAKRFRDACRRVGICSLGQPSTAW